MKYYSTVIQILFGALLSQKSVAQTNLAWIYPKDASPKIVTLDHDFLVGDFTSFLRDLPEAWASADGNAMIEKSLLRLSEQAYAVNNGKLAGGFDLPVEVEKLKLIQRRIQDHSSISYVVEFGGATKGRHKIQDLKLIRYPDEVILDWRDSQLEHAQENNGSFYLKRLNVTPVPEGLYKVAITLDNGSAAEKWIPVVDWASDRNPQVLQPSLNQSYEHADPIVSWLPYSTGNRSYAFRGFNAEVIYNDAPDYGWDKKWSVRGGEGDLVQYVVGAAVSNKNEKDLGKGRYLFNLTYAEERECGDLTISKASAYRVPFYVR